MATRIIYGYVKKDRSIQSSSGDFKIGEKVEDGVFTIMFNTSFADTPAVTATVMSNGGTSHLDGIQVSAVSQDQCQLVIINTGNQSRYDNNFLFTAIGPGDD